MLAALGILAAVINARETGQGRQIEVAQSDAAAYMDWYRIETWKAYERPEDEVTGNPSDDYERRPPGLAGMWEGVRYQIYESKDGHVLFMASEQVFWKNFCEGVGRPELFEKWPGSQYADHAKGNLELQGELQAIFKEKSSSEWIKFSEDQNTPIAPVYNAKTAPNDPQFQHRLPFYSIDELGAEQLPLPVNVIGEETNPPSKAPSVGEHTNEVLANLLGYEESRISGLRDNGVFG